MKHVEFVNIRMEETLCKYILQSSIFNERKGKDINTFVKGKLYYTMVSALIIILIVAFFNYVYHIIDVRFHRRLANNFIDHFTRTWWIEFIHDRATWTFRCLTGLIDRIYSVIYSLRVKIEIIYIVKKNFFFQNKIIFSILNEI